MKMLNFKVGDKDDMLICRERGTKKSESPKGIEPMTSIIPVGHSSY